LKRTLKEALSDVLSAGELSNLYSSFDTIGDVIIIKIPDALQQKKRLIGQAILENLKPVKVVLMQKGPVSGEFRTRELKHLAGENRTTTIYKEHGCNFLVDLATAYFSPRLSTERLRIANLVKPNERVLNMFAGVGAFSIVIARVQPECKVVSIDVNPEAHRFAVENAKINKVAGRVDTILGDARKIIKSGNLGKFTRVLMPLPESASEYLGDAIFAVEPSGAWIHYYTHVHSENKDKATEQAKSDLRARLRTNHKIDLVKVVREVGPRWFQVVADIHLA
jgi:tRNA (guanine37-N1)-methyltransferase